MLLITTKNNEDFKHLLHLSTCRKDTDNLGSTHSVEPEVWT